MLHPVEVLPGSRRSLRRAVRLETEVVASHWDAPRRHRVTDLSPEGMRLAAGTRLHPGEIVTVSFTPPGWWMHDELTVFSRVARSAPRRSSEPAWIGLEFLDLPRGARGLLSLALRGLPPPIPARRARHPRELVWIDMLVTYTEDFGDRVNTFEVSEVLKAVEADELAPSALAPLLTGRAA